jgi:hypothetical protein
VLALLRYIVLYLEVIKYAGFYLYYITMCQHMI